MFLRGFYVALAWSKLHLFLSYPTAFFFFFFNCLKKYAPPKVFYCASKLVLTVQEAKLGHADKHELRPGLPCSAGSSL